MIVVVVVMIFHDAAAADDSVVEAMGERLSGKHFLLAEALELSREGCFWESGVQR